VVTADQRRQAVHLLQETFGVSQRRACGVLGQHRSTQRQPPRTREGEPRLVQRMLELVRRHPRFGYRRIWALLRREGGRVNRKRVERLGRREGLKVPRKRRKKRRRGSSANGCVRRRALHKDHVWAWDFIHDRTTDGRPLKWLTLVDEYTRACLLLEVARSITARKAVPLVADVIRQRGAPAHVRSANGPEFIAQAMRAWLVGVAVETLYVEPGAPWENGYAESFNSKVRDEFLATEEFSSELEARVLGRQWKQGYNHERPHSALGYRTPAEYAIGCPRPDSAALRPGKDTTVTIDPTLTSTGP
jgi:transposase InsO family protein